MITQSDNCSSHSFLQAKLAVSFYKFVFVLYTTNVAELWRLYIFDHHSWHCILHSNKVNPNICKCKHRNEISKHTLTNNLTLRFLLDCASFFFLSSTPRDSKKTPSGQRAWPLGRQRRATYIPLACWHPVKVQLRTEQDRTEPGQWTQRKEGSSGPVS